MQTSRTDTTCWGSYTARRTSRSWHGSNSSFSGGSRTLLLADIPVRPGELHKSLRERVDHRLPVTASELGRASVGTIGISFNLCPGAMHLVAIRSMETSGIGILRIVAMGTRRGNQLGPQREH